MSGLPHPNPAAPPLVAAQWPAVASLALGVFGLVTAEFLPASLFTAMAADLAIGGGLLVDHIGALGGPGFAVATLTLGTLLTLRHGPRPHSIATRSRSSHAR